MTTKKPEDAEPTRELRAAARCSEVLFLLTLLLVIATLGLNRALSENRSEATLRYLWYEDTGSMLARARAYRERGPRFFEGIVISVLTHSRGWHEDLRKKYPTIARLAQTGTPQIIRSPSSGSVLDVRDDYDRRIIDESLSELGDQAVHFGHRVAELLQIDCAPEDRIGPLTTAAADCFESVEVQRFMQNEGVIRAIAHSDQPTQWPSDRVAAWVVYGEWPPERSGIVEPVPGISYVKRFLPSADLHSKRRFLSELVATTSDAAQAEQLVNREWLTAFERLEAIPSGELQVGVPAGGLSLRASDVVMLAGPILVIVQAFFAMFWVRHWSNVTTPGPDTSRFTILRVEPRQAFMFPAFDCPLDPLFAPIPKTTEQITQRLTWLFTLLIPALVLFVALVCRYDLTGLTRGRLHTLDPFQTTSAIPGEHLPSGSPLLAHLSALREHDGLSVALDTINMLSLLASLILLIRITTVARCGQSPRPRNKTLTAACIALVLLWLLTIWLWSSRLDSFSPLVFGWM